MEPKIYLVGGAVRDKLLGKEARDLDYVVVGATLAWMFEQGFEQVGAAFPVFLHPKTGDEYAMARREVKTGNGYTGFSFEFAPDVTLEEDLGRRDLTINSMAMAEDGTLVDPYGGAEDLRAGVLRHTSNAFAEDPLRVLRLARFAARYNFEVAPETIELAQQLVKAGELDHLTPERVWVEVEKMLEEKHLSAAFDVMKKAGCTQVASLSAFFGNMFSDEFPHEETMTSAERAYWFTLITTFDNDQRIALCVPTKLARKLELFRQIKLVSGMWEHRNPLMPDYMITMFDTFRNDLSPEMIEEVNSFCKLLGNNRSGFMRALDRMMSALRAIDFTELVKTVPPTEIKSFVRRTKEAALEQVL